MEIRKYFYPLLIVFVGCLGTNFSAYFNTYYNIQRIAKRLDRLERLGDTLAARSLYDSLETKCAYLIKYYPTSKYLPDAVFYLGLAFSRKGQYEKAIQKFKEFLEFFPSHPLSKRAKLELGRVYALDPRYRSEAIGVLKDLNDDEAKYWIAYAYYHLGDYEAAKDYITGINFSLKDPRVKRYYLLAIDVFISLNDPSKANEYLKKYLSLNLLPSEKKIAKEKEGDIFMKMGRYEDAIDVYSSIDYPPKGSDDGRLKFKIAEAYMVQSDTPKSIENYELCFSSSAPEKWLCGYKVANLYLAKGDIDKAARFYESLYMQGGPEWKEKASIKKLVLDEWRILMKKDDINSLYRKAEIYYFHLQDRDISIKIWKNLAKKGDKTISPKSLYALIYAYLSEGDTDSARMYFDHLKNEYKDSKYINFASSILGL